MVVGVVVVAVVLLGLPLAAAVLAPRLGPPRSHPRTGTRDRVWHLARGRGGPESTRPPGGVSPGQLGAMVVPDAHYQQVTATLLDLAARGHLAITLTSVPSSAQDVAWWTLTRLEVDDELQPFEHEALRTVGVLEGPAVHPDLTVGATDRVARAVRHRLPRQQGVADEASAFQRGVARHPELVEAQYFAHAVALDVSPALAPALDRRRAPVPAWATSSCGHPVTWDLLQDFALDGSPLLPQGVYTAGWRTGRR